MPRTMSISLAELKEFHPCRPEERFRLFESRTTLSVSQALKLGVSIDDILWVAGRLGQKDLCVKFALGCAQHISHLSTHWASEAAAWASEAARYAAGAAAGAAGYAEYAEYAAEYAAGYAAGAAAETAFQKKLLISVFSI